MKPAGQVVLQAQGLGKRYEEGRIALDVLQDIDLSVHAGEVFVPRAQVKAGYRIEPFLIAKNYIHSMKKCHIISSLLFAMIFPISPSIWATPESESGLSGKELLIAVVSSKYPAETPGYNCEDFIPAFTKLKPAAGCHAVQKAAPQIAFVGDSHTKHYRASALSAFRPLNPILISEPECFPFTAHTWKTYREGTCAGKQEAVLDYLSQAASIQTVVLSSYWSRLMSGSDFEATGDGWLKMAPMSDEDKKIFISNGQHFISTLLKKGKRVVLMRDIPDLDFKPETCYDIRPVRLGNTEIRKDCSMAQEPFELRRQLQNAVLDEMLKSFPSVKVYDPVPLFCQKGRCKASDGTLPYYFDINHVNNYGAQLVFKDFATKLFSSLSPATKAD